MGFANVLRRTLGLRNAERIGGALIDAGTELLDVPFTDEAAERMRKRVMLEIDARSNDHAEGQDDDASARCVR